MKIQTCDKLGVKTFTDITDKKEILRMLNDIFTFEEAYRVLELTSDEEKTLESYYRQNIATDDMPSCIDGYLLDHGDKWYMFRSDDVYLYYYTVEQHYQSTLNELAYIQIVMENIEKES